MDKDEDIDVVAASRSPNNKIMWYENDGSQYFNHHVISDSVRDARFVSAGDVDGDGYMDVISGHSKISWYEYDGLNSFIDHTVSTSGSKSVHAIDVNGDGYMDVVAAKRSGIQWHENDG